MSLAQALNSLPRRRLLDGPTPIRRLHGIENALGSSSNRVQIYAKRDDLMSLGGGGNKLRKLTGGRHDVLKHEHRSTPSSLRSDSNTGL